MADWNELGNEITGEAEGDLSGLSVSLSEDGTVVAIGTGYNDENGNNSGHVRIYEYASGSWSQRGSDIDGEDGGYGSAYSLTLLTASLSCPANTVVSLFGSFVC